jgi:hypothetical protein
MSTRTARILLLGALLLLLPAATGQAKGIRKAEVCGPAGCATIHGTPDELMTLAEVAGTAAAPRPAAWYRVRLTIGPEGGEDFEPVILRSAYVPARGLVRTNEGGLPNWMEPYPAARRKLDAAVRGLAPFPAATLRGAARAAPERRAPAVVRSSAGGDEGGPWLALAGAAAALGLGVGLVVAARRRALRPR